jgi:gamma-glutamyltranspeptidase / glutathione hydrolase
VSTPRSVSRVAPSHEREHEREHQPEHQRQPVGRHYAANGMVCAVDHLAAGAGVAMMRAGGSAADAAVASSAVLAVTSPHLCGMGGDLFAVVAGPGGRPLALDSSGFAGAGADPDQLRAEGHTTMPFRGDIRTVTVPGCVDGWLALHAAFGRLPLTEVLAPARDYAADGFPVSPSLAVALPAVGGLADTWSVAALGAVRPGQVVRQPGLARVLEAIAAGGRDGFYAGEAGQGLLELGDGYFAPSDLDRPIARWSPALGAAVWGRQCWTAPPPSQGYLTLASARIASMVGLPEDPQDPAWVHLLVESARQAGWDRLEVLADTSDGDALLADDRLAPRWAAVHSDRAATLGDAHAAGDTIATVAVDGQREGVSLLQSNAAGFGAHLMVPGVELLLHNRGIGFSLRPGHPAEYQPGRRPPHTLSPLAVTEADGSLTAVAGTMGGDAQPQILLQLLARFLVARDDPAEVVAAPRWMLTSPDPSGGGFDAWRRHGRVRVAVEGHAPDAWAAGLAARGHDVVFAPAFADHRFGHAHLIAVNADHLAGGTDPRARAGGALGW